MIQTEVGIDRCLLNPQKRSIALHFHSSHNLTPLLWNKITEEYSAPSIGNRAKVLKYCTLEINN
jgi:hypothetical protein